MDSPPESSILFHASAILVGTAVGAIGLALLAGLTGGAILAPLGFVALFAPLLAVQYLLWGRFLNRALQDDDTSSSEVGDGQADESLPS